MEEKVGWLEAEEGDGEEEWSDKICTGKWDSSNNNSNCSTNKTTNKPLNIYVIFKVPKPGEGTNDSSFPLHPQDTAEGLVSSWCTSKPKINLTNSRETPLPAMLSWVVGFFEHQNGNI